MYIYIVHDKYSDACERQHKDVQIKSQGSNLKEKLLPRVGLEPTTCTCTMYLGQQDSVQISNIMHVRQLVMFCFRNTLRGQWWKGLSDT